MIFRASSWSGGEPFAHRLIDEVAVLHAVGVGGETRIVVHLGLADDLEDAAGDLRVEPESATYLPSAQR